MQGLIHLPCFFPSSVSHVQECQRCFDEPHETCVAESFNAILQNALDVFLPL